MTWIEGSWVTAKSNKSTVSGKFTVGMNYDMAMTSTALTIRVQDVVVMPAGGDVTIKYPGSGNISAIYLPTTYYYLADIKGPSKSVSDVKMTGGWSYKSSTTTASLGTGKYAKSNAAYRMTDGYNETYQRTHSNQTITLKATAHITAASPDSASFDLSVTQKITIPAKEHYTLVFDPNGGVGGPGSMTKWYGEPITIPSYGPIKGEQTFIGWATSPTGSVQYKPGDTFNLDSFGGTLYAVWVTALVVRYDANGGENAPETQIDYSGAPYITLSDQIPTKKGGKFLGWATSSTATEPEYYSGGIYRSQLSTTLYAVWELAYSVKLDTINVSRCLADGTPDGMGEYMSINGRYILQGNTAFDSQVSIQVLSPSITASTITGKTYNKYASEEKATPTFKWFSGDDSSVKFDPEQMYEIRVTVGIYSSGSLLDSVSRVVTLSRAEYILDFSSTGKGMGIGSVAPPSGLDISWDTTFYDLTDFRGTVKIANKDDWKNELEIEKVLDSNGLVPVSKGGTGVRSLSEIRDAIGLGASTDVLDIAHGGTGADNASTARTNLGIPMFPLQIVSGGTGATSAAAARTNLGIPSFPLSVANGGTGASNASTARSNLGVTGFTISNWTTINLSAGSLAEGGTKTVTATGTLSKSGASYVNCALKASAYSTASGVSVSLSGTTVTVSATLYNCSRGTHNCSVSFLVIALFTM